MTTLSIVTTPLSLPSELRVLVDQVNSEAVEYKGRSNNIDQMQRYIDGGEFGMAEHMAQAIIERQSNIRRGLPNKNT